MTWPDRARLMKTPRQGTTVRLLKGVVLEISGLSFDRKQDVRSGQRSRWEYVRLTLQRVRDVNGDDATHGELGVGRQVPPFGVAQEHDRYRNADRASFSEGSNGSWIHWTH